MPISRLFTAASLVCALSAGPVLTGDAFAQSSKSRAAKSSPKAKAKPAADTASAAPAEAAETPAAPEQQIATSNPAANIPAVLQASGQFTTLLKAVQATNLTSVLSSPARPLTVFAPTDQAFAALSPGVLEALMLPANADTLQKILTYHVVATKLPASQIRGKAASPVPTAGGASVTISGVGGAIKVGDATVIQSDVQASNGVIHVIDKVLLPPGLRLPSGATGAEGSTAAPATAGAATAAPAPAPASTPAPPR